MPYVSEEGHQAKTQGRLFICRVDTAKGYEAILVSMYCWSGGNDKVHLRDRTNALLRAMRIEIKALSKYPVIVSIDLNGDIPNFSEMEPSARENSGTWAAYSIGTSMERAQAYPLAVGMAPELTTDVITCFAMHRSSRRSMASGGDPLA